MSKLVSYSKWKFLNESNQEDTTLFVTFKWDKMNISSKLENCIKSVVNRIPTLSLKTLKLSSEFNTISLSSRFFTATIEISKSETIDDEFFNSLMPDFSYKVVLSIPNVFSEPNKLNDAIIKHVKPSKCLFFPTENKKTPKLAYQFDNLKEVSWSDLILPVAEDIVKTLNPAVVNSVKDRVEPESFDISKVIRDNSKSEQAVDELKKYLNLQVAINLLSDSYGIESEVELIDVAVAKDSFNKEISKLREEAKNFYNKKEEEKATIVKKIIDLQKDLGIKLRLEGRKDQKVIMEAMLDLYKIIGALSLEKEEIKNYLKSFSS